MHDALPSQLPELAAIKPRICFGQSISPLTVSQDNILEMNANSYTQYLTRPPQLAVSEP